MTNYQDFGFGGKEFVGELNAVPYAQFLNGNSKNFGLAITKNNIEMADFDQDGAIANSWRWIEYEFGDGALENLMITETPRLVVINRGSPLMANEEGVLPYDKDKYSSGEYKAFSYAVIWFLDAQNQPLSKLPFRLKCSGYSGITFLKNYAYYNNVESFTKKFLNVYKNLTNDRGISKNDVFFAHSVYAPQIDRNKVTSSINGQSSFAVTTTTFVEPTPQNFASLIISNGSSASDRIKELITETKEWVKSAVLETEAEEQADSNYSSGYNANSSGEEVGLTPPKPNQNGSSADQQEYAEIIKQGAKVTGWTQAALDSYLVGNYRVNSDNLTSLPEQQLIEIYRSLQDDKIKQSYCNSAHPVGQQKQLEYHDNDILF